MIGATALESASPQATDQFQDQISKARSAFESRNPLGEVAYRYFIETIFRPAEFDQYKFPRSRLESAAQRAHTDFVGWPFLFFPYSQRDMLTYTDDGLETLICTKDYANVDILDFWRLNESGMFYKRELTPTSHIEPPEASAPRIIWHFAEAIYCLTRLYEGMFPDTEPISLTVTLFGTRGRLLAWREIGFHHSGYEANRPSIEVSSTHPLADWRAGLEDHAVDLARQVLQHFQLANPDEMRIRMQIRTILQREN